MQGCKNVTILATITMQWSHFTDKANCIMTGDNVVSQIVPMVLLWYVVQHHSAKSAVNCAIVCATAIGQWQISVVQVTLSWLLITYTIHALLVHRNVIMSTLSHIAPICKKTSPNDVEFVFQFHIFTHLFSCLYFHRFQVAQTLMHIASRTSHV